MANDSKRGNCHFCYNFIANVAIAIFAIVCYRSQRIGIYIYIYNI